MKILGCGQTVFDLKWLFSVVCMELLEDSVKDNIKHVNRGPKKPTHNLNGCEAGSIRLQPCCVNRGETEES